MKSGVKHLGTYIGMHMSQTFEFGFNVYRGFNIYRGFIAPAVKLRLIIEIWEVRITSIVEKAFYCVRDI